MTALIDRWGVYVFVGIPMLCYASQGAFVYLKQGRYGMALAMAGYCFANVGIILDAKGI